MTARYFEIPAEAKHSQEGFLWNIECEMAAYGKELDPLSLVTAQDSEVGALLGLNGSEKPRSFRPS